MSSTSPGENCWWQGDACSNHWPVKGGWRVHWIHQCTYVRRLGNLIYSGNVSQSAPVREFATSKCHVRTYRYACILIMVHTMVHTVSQYLKELLSQSCIISIEKECFGPRGLLWWEVESTITGHGTRSPANLECIQCSSLPAVLWLVVWTCSAIPFFPSPFLDLGYSYFQALFSHLTVHLDGLLASDLVCRFLLFFWGLLFHSHNRRPLMRRRRK